jgi:pyruvate kinase
MPVDNDPKRRVNRSASQRVRAQLEAQTAHPATQASAAKPAQGLDSFARGVFTVEQLGALDALWTSKSYAKIVDKVHESTQPLVGRDFAGLDPEALYQLATQLFVLEQRMGAVINKLSLVDGPSAAEAKATSLKALDTQRTIAAAQTAVFRQAVALQDASTPTPVGQWVVFRDTQKKPGFHTPAAQELYYVEKLRKFISQGGDPSQIRPLDAQFLKDLPSGALVEYAVDSWDVARASVIEGDRPSPGHTLLASGGDALTAGSLTVTKNERGDITQVLIGTFSGHYRSGIEAQQHLVRHLVAAGVAPERIVQREAQAGNPRTQEILGRILGMKGPEAQRDATKLIEDAYRWDPLAMPAEAPEGPKGAKKPPFAKHLLADAMLQMRLAVSNAIADGILLSEQPTPGGSEVQKVVNAVDDVLRLAQDAGNPLAWGQARALVRHLASLPAANIDDDARLTMQKLKARIEAAPFGKVSAFDPADVFGPRPTRDRRARVVATINPKATEAQLRDMIAAGMDIARFNTAHGTTDEQVALMKRVRSAAASVGKPVTIQIDLEGPKIRLGKFANPNNLEFNDQILEIGKKVTLTTDVSVLGNPSLLPVDFPTLCDDLDIGEPVFMNDGTVELKVISIDKAAGTVEAEVVMGGKVWDKKGINLPQSNLSVRTITDEDLANLEALLPHVDLVASSFVREPADILFLRKRMEQLGRVVPIIAKIERREGLENLEQIALVSDALMVARGDLGVEIGYENVPGAERRINAVGKLYGKATMVATEVLMSMVKDPSRPSRGDVEGLYAAIYDRGADAIMLGKETSFPAHPAEVVRAASRVIEKAEEERREDPYKQDLDAVAHAGGLAALTAADLQRGRTISEGN